VAGDAWGRGDARNDVLPRLWAARKIGFLIDDARLNERPIDGEVRDEVIKLSKKYGIVTPLTAALITEDGAVPNSPIAAGGGFGGAPGTVFRSGGRGASADSAAKTQSYAGFGGAAAPSSGANAVRAAKAGREMRETERVKDDANARYIEGKAFFLRDGVWTDTAFDAAKSPKPETIKFGSTPYFALLKEKDARIAKWLSIGERAILVIGNRVIKIEP